MCSSDLQRERTEQRIRNRMRQHIRVAVTEQPGLMRNLHAADDALATGRELMNVNTDANSIHEAVLLPVVAALAKRGYSRSRSNASAVCKSTGVVILRFRNGVSTKWTRSPSRSTAAASSVTITPASSSCR